MLGNLSLIILVLGHLSFDILCHLVKAKYRQETRRFVEMLTKYLLVF
jgi:hypothetical protein